MIFIFDKIKVFWAAFWNGLKYAYNKAFKEIPKSATQQWRDIAKINFLDVFVQKINNLTNVQATFDIESDSTNSEPIEKLCKDLESKRYELTEQMLADGDCFVFPAISLNGRISHTVLNQDQVRILSTDGKSITEALGIIDWVVDSRDKTYYLLRKHALKGGNLTIDYSVVDIEFKPATVEKWEYLNGKAYQFANANHIGFGRYKSPQTSRGLSPIYGVPLNFGCEEIENKIFNDLEMIEVEFKRGESKIFADPLIMKKSEKGYEIPEGVFPVQTRAGQSGKSIDIFSPALRYSAYYEKLKDDLALYEKQVGTSKGILTENEITSGATATEVKRANADTIALIDKIHTAIDEGNKMTLAADGVYLNVSPDAWSYRSDWYDPFEDPAEQWKRLIEAKENGAAETADLIKWQNPSLTDEDIENKISRITEDNRNSAQAAFDNMIGIR